MAFALACSSSSESFASGGCCSTWTAAGEVELGDADGQLELRELGQRGLQDRRVKGIAVEVPLHADATDRDALIQQAADVRDVIVQTVAREDVVVVQEEDGVGVALADPGGHVPRDLRAQTLLVIVAVDHLVVQVVLGEPAAIARADVQGPGLERLAQGRIVQGKDPRLDEVPNPPEDIVAPQRDFVLVGPLAGSRPRRSSPPGPGVAPWRAISARSR
jgi:hypothetical protein